MRRCSCCGSALVRVWLFEKCGACYRAADEWDEQQHEDVLKACMSVLDPRHRSLPFFTPVAEKKRRNEDELS